MGQEIALEHFDSADFERFHHRLSRETNLLKQVLAQQGCSMHTPMAGFEIEAWLVDDKLQPAAINEYYLECFKHPLAFPELAKFNIEFNCLPTSLADKVFSQLHTQLQTIWEAARHQAEQLNSHLLMIGVLPTLKQSDLHLGNMSNLNRYRALNEQIFRSRGKPIHVDIVGHEHLKIDHHDVMLESATTSLQTHIQVPLSLAHHFYNASMISSAAMVAACANSPFVFGKQLWQESRIPLFEQAVETGGYAGIAQGPLNRVSFGSGYAKKSIMECFEENLAFFPVLLPSILSDNPNAFEHLRLHNGTIWRWNRPLVGFDQDGSPHIRIEHRTPAAGPTVIDSIANMAFYYGLSQNLCDEIIQQGDFLSFSWAKDNFYQAARHGLDSHIMWKDGQKHTLRQLLLTELLPRARAGLKTLNVDSADSKLYLDVIQQRVSNHQTGSQWQIGFIQKHHDFLELTRQYLQQQNAGNPVSEWPL